MDDRTYKIKRRSIWSHLREAIFSPRLELRTNIEAKGKLPEGLVEENSKTVLARLAQMRGLSPTRIIGTATVGTIIVPKPERKLQKYDVYIVRNGKFQFWCSARTIEQAEKNAAERYSCEFQHHLRTAARL
jgi:hypothetical protein